ncbi:hypothetical protein [Niallia nealsonii]|uniref:Uncharacterized protein n=1 Tax=Niallia nealsonii TaxID=115979 RepID=A0A2N0YZZ6_9BACI|nr:hypothetical protein [Niallia nealsonii]PKG22836.1 hypothetical protein CWS01_14195 [Niallia nealsonii]
MKKKLLISGLVGVLLLGILIGYYAGREGFIIKIKNNSDTTISNLYITYTQAPQDKKILKIDSNAKYSINIIPDKSVDEGEMRLYYFDNNGKKHQITLVGYFEKGYIGRVSVTIKSINENGEMKFKVNSNN